MGNIKKSNVKILVVDDELTIRMLLAEMLKISNYTVKLAANVSEALTALKTEPFDLIISDINMPGPSGKDLLEIVKKDYPKIPFIVITGDPRVEMAVECLRIGALSYVPKPFSFKKLNEIIKEALKKSKNGQRLIGKYAILSMLGEGNMGLVFKVEKDDKIYALKVIKQAILASDEKDLLLKRFAIEIKLASSVKHPNVVQVLDSGAEKGLPYLVMEYVDGRSLERIIKKEKLTYTQKVMILRQLALALSALHQHNILHRDVKPGNIIVTEDGLAKITDFGIARDPTSTLTMTSHIFGTPTYMAPESFLSSRVDNRSDIFAFGLTSYELFFSQKAFDGENIAQVITRITQDLPLAPEKIDPNFPKPLASILARTLKKDPQKRYQSITDVIKDLDKYLESKDKRTLFSKFKEIITKTTSTSDWKH